MTRWDITEGIIMKQLFKTFTMLLFVGVLFTNKLNAQMTLEHTFEGEVYPTMFGEYYYKMDYYEEESLAITLYDSDCNLYKQITIPFQQGYDGISEALLISPEIILTVYVIKVETKECYWWKPTMIFYDIDGNIIKKIDYTEGEIIEPVPNSKNKFYLGYGKDGKFFVEIYSIDGYESVKNVRATSFGHAYPNPARNTISLPYNLNKGEQAEMLIYDVNGKMIEKKTIDSTFDKILLNVESYTPGIYFYSVNGVSHKFVVR